MSNARLSLPGNHHHEEDTPIYHQQNFLSFTDHSPHSQPYYNTSHPADGFDMPGCDPRMHIFQQYQAYHYPSPHFTVAQSQPPYHVIDHRQFMPPPSTYPSPYQNSYPSHSSDSYSHAPDSQVYRQHPDTCLQSHGFISPILQHQNLLARSPYPMSAHQFPHHTPPLVYPIRWDTEGDGRGQRIVPSSTDLWQANLQQDLNFRRRSMANIGAECGKAVPPPY